MTGTTSRRHEENSSVPRPRRPPLTRAAAVSSMGKDSIIPLHSLPCDVIIQSKVKSVENGLGPNGPHGAGLQGAWQLLQTMCSPPTTLPHITPQNSEPPPQPPPPLTPPPPPSSWMQRGIRRLLLIRQRSVGSKSSPEDAEEALQTMLPMHNKTVLNGGGPPMQTPDPRITGEVCLLQDSPYRILRAAESGNLESFSRLYFAEPSRLEVKDSRGRTATHQAAVRNRVNILQFILSHNGDLNVVDNAGNTPLHLAVENDALDVVEFLLQREVATGLLNERKQAPLHVAVEMNRVRVLEVLCKYRDRVDVQQGGEHGRTALHIAAIYDHEECARILITQFGAVPRKPCNNGYYPIHEAAKNASSRTMEVFLQWGESRGCSREEMISFFDSEGNVPLHSAVHGGDIKAVELCLKSGAKISTQQHDLSTPVHLACAQGAVEIVRLMFRMQPDEKLQCMASCDVQKMTPLHCAAMFDHPDIVQFLVAEGADINSMDKERRSPLLLAASRSGWRTVHALIQLGADILLKEVNNRNVLHLIVMNGGRLEEFAQQVYQSQAQTQLAQLLNEKDLAGCSPLHYASREGQVRSLENLIRLGACINLKNNNNESPLHFAARYGRYNTVRQLLDSEKGSFIINESDGEGLTPLHIASQQGHSRVVQLLLNRGALLHRDHLGRNPLHLAAMSGYTHTMMLLHAVHSHLLDQADKDGNTALHLATMENKPSAIVLLLSMGCKLLYNLKDLSAIDYAIYYKFPEAALAMVTHQERAQEVMALKSDKHPCVTLALIASMPRVFEAVQDRCITKANCKKDSKSFYIKYSFSCLQCRHLYAQVDQRTGEALLISRPIPLPALNIKYSFKNYEYSPEKIEKMREYHNDPKWMPEPMCVANAMVAHGRVELLAHPLSQKYLQMKWNSYGKYFHLANLLLYTVFLAFVTCFVAQLMSFTADVNTGLPLPRLNATDGRDVSPEEILAEARELRELREHGGPIMSMSGMAILVYIGLSALREGLQVYQQRWHYLLDPFNLVSWLLYISAGAMVIPLITGGVANVQLSCASATAFLAWFNLLLYLQRFDQVGIYVVMFLEILQTLIKVLLVFSILIIAFGLALFILLSRGQHLAFNTVPMSLMRTFAMMLGEIDFLGTYVHSLYNRNDEGGRGRSLPYPVATFVILGIFMVFMPILLMNLLIGLAVGDIESVRRNAQLKRLAMQVVLHTELERKLPRMLLERVDKIEMIEYPNDHKCKKGFLDSVLRKWFCNPFSEEDSSVERSSRSSNRLNIYDPTMALDCTDELVLEELDKQRRRLREMSVMLEGQHQLLRLIVQKMEIKTEADDVDEGVSPRDLQGGSRSLARWTSPRLDKKTRSMLSQSRHSPT